MCLLIPNTNWLETTEIENAWQRDPEGSERYTLQMSREFLIGDEIALAGAKALARHKENNHAGKSNHAANFKTFTRGSNFLRVVSGLERSP